MSKFGSSRNVHAVFVVFSFFRDGISTELSGVFFLDGINDGLFRFSSEMIRYDLILAVLGYPQQTAGYARGICTKNGQEQIRLSCNEFWLIRRIVDENPAPPKTYITS